MSSARQTILCVEDDPAILYLIDRMLATFLDFARFEVCCVASGSTALAILPHNSIALVITDYVMPDVNGLQVHAAIKHRSPTTPVMLVTGYTSDELAAKAHAVGVDAYMIKPFVLSDFRATVQTLLGLAAV